MWVNLTSLVSCVIKPRVFQVVILSLLFVFDLLIVVYYSMLFVCILIDSEEQSYTVQCVNIFSECSEFYFLSYTLSLVQPVFMFFCASFLFEGLMLTVHCIMIS